MVEDIILYGTMGIPYWLLWRYGDARLFPQLTLSFLISCQTNTIITMVLYNRHMLEFPHRLLPKFTDIPLNFDYSVLPILHVFFLQWTFRESWWKASNKALLITTILTIFEILFETFTDLITYYTWTWYFTFLTVWIVLILNRWIVLFWFRKTSQHSHSSFK